MKINSVYPNFLIVGTAKAATTTIYRYLQQHPDIFLSERKEPCFFTFANQQKTKYSTGRPVQFVTDFDDYLSLFEKAEHYKIRGEASTPYLYFYNETIANIKKYHPHYKKLKILIALRNPVERAYSQYMMKVRDLVEDKTFKEALQLEEKRMQENAHFDFFYKDRGLYFNQVKAYLDVFDDVKIVFYDDIKHNVDNVLEEITEFLNVKKHVYTKIRRQNVSGVSRFKFLTHLIREKSWFKNLFRTLFTKKLKKKIRNYVMVKNVKKIDMLDYESSKLLKNYYEKDIKKLEKLLNEDLSNWC